MNATVYSTFYAASYASFLYAGILGLLSVLLANQVLRARIRQDSPDWKGQTTLRVQANFVENVPLALILLFAVELTIGGGSSLPVHILGCLLVLCRVLHAYGMSRDPGANYPRLIGAQGTFVLLSVMSVTLIYTFVSRL